MFKIDNALTNTLRMFPTLQNTYKSLTVTKDLVNSKLTIAYRPNNCTINLNPIAIRQAISNVCIFKIKCINFNSLLSIFFYFFQGTQYC